MISRKIVVVGGGAAGFFGAITSASTSPNFRALILERGSQFLQKVRISGGGRCNVTHACFNPRELSRSYPRGENELIGLLRRFQVQDTVQWFADQGVVLKIEKDGRMFPTTDSSQTIIDCLMVAAKTAGVEMRVNCGVEHIERLEDRFLVHTTSHEVIEADRLLLATGGCRTPALGSLATRLGHTLSKPVPSLFTLHVETPWVRALAGVTVEKVEVSLHGTDLKETGPILLTHWGLSGPVILRISAWGARLLHDLNYKGSLRINWLPDTSEDSLRSLLQERIKLQSAKRVVNSPLAPISARLWEALVTAAGIPSDRRWSELGRNGLHTLVETLFHTVLPVTGKSLNKDEFVTCGGVKLTEVDLKTMESKACPGLFFAGELLDIDGITGGFNFQAAWTTGWVAGQSMTHP